MSEIIKKALSECVVESVSLFNWGEPLLHPKLADMIRIVKSFRVSVYLGTNLNIRSNYDELLESEPDRLMISCSGFHKQTYEMTHRGGRIENIKLNMEELSRAKLRTSSKTVIELKYHRYLGNLDDEVEMRQFSKQLGFDFSSTWAYLMNVEKLLEYIHDDLGIIFRQSLGSFMDI